MYRNQNINLPTSYGEQLVITTLDNPAVGTTEDTNARFLNAAVNRGSRPLADWCTVTTTAADGSSFELLLPGLYQVEASVFIQGSLSPSYVVGITLDAPLATRQANPLISATGVEASGRWGGTAAGAGSAVTLSTFVRITATMANTSGLGVVRLGLSDGSNGAPVVANLARPESYLKITRVAALDDQSTT